MHISLMQAAQLLQSAQVVAVPTETVYGLAASLHCPDAIARIFALKGRPSTNPLIIHVAEFAHIAAHVPILPPNFERLAEAFWPGPLTLVLSVDVTTIPANARAGLSTAAFRVPNHPLALELIRAVGPLVMPSANLSGTPSATRRAHVERDFGIAFPVVDGGACLCGLESTILYWREQRWEIIRLGALSAESFAPILGYSPFIAQKVEGEAPICPGQLYRHYAPRAHLRLTFDYAEEMQGEVREAIIGFSDRDYPTACRLFALGSSSAPEQSAENLYAVLRQLDEEGIESAWVDMNFPRSGLWLTLAERLERAAK